jgi:hypothetical protein
LLNEKAMGVFKPIVIKTAHTEIFLDNEGILRVKAVKEGEMDLVEVRECFEAYKKIGCFEKKALQLVDFTVSVLVTKEAREFIDKMADKYFIASAILTESLPVRIIINFSMKFFNPAVPIKMFSKEAEALEWLRSIQKNS